MTDVSGGDAGARSNDEADEPDGHDRPDEHDDGPPPPERPLMSDQRRPPVRRPVPPPRPVLTARILWFASFALNAAAVLVAAFGVVIVVDVVAAARAGTPEPELSATMGRLGDAAFAALPDRDGAVELRVRGREGAYWTSAGVVDVLENHGVDVRVGPELEFAYGPHRLVRGDRVRARRRAANRWAHG